MSSEADASPRMDKDRDRVAKKVLKLTLEIIHLLTGEDYGPIKNSTPADGEQSVIPEPDFYSLKPEGNKKILEVIHKISVLLTGEVPVRCQDVTVTFSLEEWEFLEGHTDMYDDVITENQLPLTSLGGSLSPNTERSPSPLDAQDHLEESIDLSQINGEESDSIAQAPKEKDGGILQAVINDLQRVSRQCRQDDGEIPKDHKQEVSIFPKESRPDADHIPKDSRPEADRQPKESKQDVDEIQRDCRQEIDLIRQICRQEVETILKDCKREIELIQKDYRSEINCSLREYKQEVSHIANDSRQEVEHISGDCKSEADPILKDCKREVDCSPKDTRREVELGPRDCKKEIEQIPNDCRWDSGHLRKHAGQGWNEDKEVQPIYEEEQMKDVKIEILSDDEWDDEEWDVQYKDDDDLIYINTDDSSPENTPEKCSQSVYVDCIEDDYDLPQAYQCHVRPEEKASSSANNTNTQMVPKGQPNVGTTSPATLNNNIAKRGPVPQRTFSPGQMESVTRLGTPPTQEHTQTGHQQQQKNINTARKTTSDIQTLQNFLSEFNENRKVEEIPHTELDTLLSKFLLVVKRKDGNEYEPHTLRCMVGSIDRYLKEHNYMHTIVYGNSKDFPLTKQSLNAKIKFLKKIAESNPPTRQEALTDDDIENLYKSGTLSMDNPTSLLNLVFFNNGLHFALRTKEQYNLQWGDIRLKIDPRGNQYLEYTDRQTEIVENRKSSRHIKPRMYATPHTPDKDPVTAYLKYRSFRPAAMMVHDAPFYLAPNVNYNPAFSEWYRSTKIGIQKIRAMMTTMKIRASLPESKKKVGYMTKKRLVERLPQHLLMVPSSAQSSPNNMRSGINHPVAAELMHHNMPANMPTMASQTQDQRFTSGTFQPRPSTSRYGEPPVTKRIFADADMVQHHGTMLQRNAALYLNSYPQVLSDDPAKKRKIAGYDFKSQ